MPILLARIDDRLVHGQVTEGWGKKIRPAMILIVSDEVAQSTWHTELCLASIPEGMRGMVTSIGDAPRVINELAVDPRPSFVIFETPSDALATVKSGAAITTINIGGMHCMTHKRCVLDYLYVDQNDVDVMRELEALGVTLDFRDLPDREHVDVMSKL